MEKIKLRSEVLLVVQNSLIGNITNNMINISIDWTSNSFKLRVYFEKEPKEEEIEIIEEITTEICSHLPFIETCEEEKRIWNYNSENQLLSETVFMRRLGIL